MSKIEQRKLFKFETDNRNTYQKSYKCETVTDRTLIRRERIIPDVEFRSECPFGLPSDEVYLRRGFKYESFDREFDEIDGAFEYAVAKDR